MESPVSPFVCKIEQIAIETAPHKSLWWFRYVNNTHTKLKKQQAQEFTDHLNSLDPDIKLEPCVVETTQTLPAFGVSQVTPGLTMTPQHM